MYVFVFAQSVQKKANICSPKQWRTEAWSIEEGEKGWGGGGECKFTCFRTTAVTSCDLV